MKSNLHLTVLSLLMVMAALSLSGRVCAQDLETHNEFIYGRVLGNDGTIVVLLPLGRVGLDASLNFYDKSFFTAKINGQYFTNNNVIQSPPPGTTKLGPPSQMFIVKGAVDTIRAIWAARNGVDIIQDVWPIKFTKSGQIMMRWSFKNLDTSSVVPIQCQWLNDVDISDPNDKNGQTANDGPIFLHRYGYYDQWQQYPGTYSPNIPWFYICFLYNLPGPKNSPGLAGQGYLDNPSIGTTKPARITMGDWYTLAQSIFGPPSNINTLLGKKPGNDDAMLIEFNPTAASKNRTVVGGITSYGTGEFERCVGNMFGLVFYPHQIDWNKSTMSYSPSPFTVELYAFDPSQFNSAANSKFTLTTCNNLLIYDSAGTNLIGTSQTLPPDPAGLSIGPGGVGVFDWYLKAQPAYFCTGNVNSCFKISGTTALGPPTYTSVLGDTCLLPITIGCAETDTLPPIHDVFTHTDFGSNDSITVHDDRANDKGLKKITWTLAFGGPASNFTITMSDSIQPCFNDKAKHLIVIHQIDSLIGGCFDFKFEDCLGNISDTTVCFPAHPKYIVPDTLKPAIKITYYGSYDSTLLCNTRIDSILTSDFRQYDVGIDSIYLLDSSNMYMLPPSKTFSPPNNFNPFRFGVHVRDSMQDGHLCLRIKDAATPKANYIDTCVYYCTIKDTLAPRISISQVSLYPPTWTVYVHDDTAWDRHINQITIVNAVNIKPVTGLGAATGQGLYIFQVEKADTTLPASFCVKASDLAGNVSSDKFCASSSVDTDAKAPNIGYSPDPRTNPTQLIVNVNDIHFNDPPANTSKYVWDTGVDSVWFTWGPDPSKPGIMEPYFPATGRKFNCDTTQLPPIVLTVIDSLNADSIPTCITIHARDCHGNDSSWMWCYPFTPDLAPPNIVAQYLNKQTVQVTLKDDSLYDRGLRSVSFANGAFNLQNVNMTLNRLPDTTFIITRTNLAQSAAATINSIDYWGTLFASELAQHSASTGIQMWIQDLAMKKGELTRQAQTFDLPVYIVKNDTVSLDRKGIRSFKFRFTMSGDISQLTFAGVKTTGTLTASNWTVTPQPVGSTVTITATAAPGTVLTQPTALDTVLLYLSFTTAASESTKDVTISIDTLGVTGGSEYVVYNGYADTVIKGYHGLSTMPPPWGSMEGSHIVIVGSCAPSLQSPDKNVRIVSLDVPMPNPVSRSVNLHYTVGEEGPVRLGVYDMLGRQVKELFNDTQKQGVYDLPFDVRELPDAQYTIRLEANGSVITRKVTVQK
ncbi:MAG: T9SS type A sorting domain-containing protein [Bacteroidetes bacterium]|nr:T9SS type A sorting domain-containing protein [Bacteroidota bacterium]